MSRCRRSLPLLLQAMREPLRRLRRRLPFQGRLSGIVFSPLAMRGMWPQTKLSATSPTSNAQHCRGCGGTSSPTKKIRLLLGLCLGLMGCQSSTDVLVEHFENMTAIAQAQRNDCDALGRSLRDYLDRHASSFQNAAANHGASSSKEARRIYTASLALDVATETCQSPEMQAFRRDLSQRVLQAADLSSSP